MNDDYDVHDEDDKNYDKTYISYDDGDDDNYNDDDNGSDVDDHQSFLKNKVVIFLSYIMCPKVGDISYDTYNYEQLTKIYKIMMMMMIMKKT